MCVDFVHLTGGASFYVSGDKVFHVRPPIVRTDESKGV